MKSNLVPFCVLLNSWKCFFCDAIFIAIDTQYAGDQFNECIGLHGSQIALLYFIMPWLYALCYPCDAFIHAVKSCVSGTGIAVWLSLKIEKIIAKNNLKATKCNLTCNLITAMD